MTTKRTRTTKATKASEAQAGGDQFGPEDPVATPRAEPQVASERPRDPEPPKVEAIQERAPLPPPTAPGATRPHVSPSQLSSYFRCGEAYRRRYLEGDKIPPGMAAHRGTGVHRGAKVNFRQKIETFRDLPTDQIVEASVAAFEAALAGEGVLLTPEERSRGERVVIAGAKDETAALAEGFAKLAAPVYQPVEIEQAVRVNLPNAPRDLFGYVDLVAIEAASLEAGASPETAARSVVDFKTGSKAKPQTEADESLQLTFYGAAYQQRHAQPLKDLRLETLILGAKGVRRQTLTTTRDRRDQLAFVNRVNALLRGVEAGIFTPAPPGSWYCSAKWCGYWATCPYVNAERASGSEGFDA